MELIDKDALVAEIERLIKKNELYLDDNVSVEVRYQKTGAYSVLCDIRHFIDTLEVKDVNFKDTKSVFEGQYLSKDKVVTTIERLQDECEEKSDNGGVELLEKLFNKLSTFEVKDPYEQCVQYDSIKAGIQAHAETYSFNIESELFHQLTKEQQKLLRKEIEQACISGGEMGVELAKDPRYKENLEVKEVDLKKEIKNEIDEYWYDNDYGAIQRRGGTVTMEISDVKEIAKHFFELGIKVSNKSIDTTSNIDDLLEEQGIDIYSREAEVIKESFYKAIDNYSSKAQKEE